MAIRLPATMQSYATAVGARKWVRRRKFPRKLWFETIDAYVERYPRLHGAGAVPSNEFIAVSLGVNVYAQGDLATHAKRENVRIESEEAWKLMCEAAGWTILQAYYRDVDKGRWPPK